MKWSFFISAEFPNSTVTPAASPHRRRKSKPEESRDRRHRDRAWAGRHNPRCILFHNTYYVIYMSRRVHSISERRQIILDSCHSFLDCAAIILDSCRPAPLPAVLTGRRLIFPNIFSHSIARLDAVGAAWCACISNVNVCIERTKKCIVFVSNTRTAKIRAA